MAFFPDISLRRAIVLLVVVVSILTAGTGITVKLTTEHLVNDDARISARDWAQFLAVNLTDLKQIAAGELPNASSLAFLEATRKAGQVFRTVIFNREGYSQLVADHEGIKSVDVSDFSAEAARSVASGSTVIDISEGEAADLPAYFARAYVPVFVDGEPAASVAVFVNETEQRANFRNTFLVAALILCSITALAFGMPAIAWYRRTKEKQQVDRRVRFLANHDSLTGLANRVRLTERLDGALSALPSSGGQIAVHFIDIDHFKEVNDLLGHDGGDFLLSTLGQRLGALTRIEDMVGRLGGDEFVVVQTGVSGKEQAEVFAQRIASAMGEPMYFKEQKIKIDVTIGVALAPADGMTSERLLKSADLALYKGKEAGRNRITIYAHEMDDLQQARRELEKAINDAIANDRFVVHYQPIFEIGRHRLIGFEALLRLSAQDGTLIPPATFIPVAEDMHVIDKLGAWVLRSACRTAATWPKNLTVAVNLSPLQFQAGTLTEVVAAALKESGLEAHRLELEIIETVMLQNNERTVAQLRDLKALGVAIVMDDFGTGYSSLSYLWKFPFDKIKIDRSFVQSFEKAGDDAATVVKSIIALGRELRMQVTVEGVETLKQADFLHESGGDQVQGFYFGRPLPASEINASILADFPKTLPVTAPLDRTNVTPVRS
ncbi:MAG: EAL domain-containing protein [Pseudolabrys sp.]|jgi:diguanylate cyclase (GGDEF)-like protein